MNNYTIIILNSQTQREHFILINLFKKIDYNLLVMGYNIPNTFNMNIIYIIQTFLSIFERNVYKHFKIPHSLYEYPDLEPGLYYKHNSPCDQVRIHILYNKDDEHSTISAL